MDQISIGYVFDNLEAFENDTAAKIVEAQGNCTDLNICLFCPFAKDCFSNIAEHARFLDRETRLRKAQDHLFDKILEEDLLG